MDNKLEVKELFPYIAAFAEPRSKCSPLPGVYDDDLNIMVIKKADEKIPLIRAYQWIETLTKTEVDRESDESANDALLETLTKTAVSRESDDENGIFNLELTTKTYVDRESDEGSSFLLEMQTKTRMEREGDDHHPEI